MFYTMLHSVGRVGGVRKRSACVESLVGFLRAAMRFSKLARSREREGVTAVHEAGLTHMKTRRFEE